MAELLQNLIYEAVMLAAVVVAGFIVAWLRQVIGAERMKKIAVELGTKKELAAIAVRFAEQFYHHSGGYEKYMKASEWLSAQSKTAGISMTADEIRGLIEAALRAFKDEFSEDGG